MNKSSKILTFSAIAIAITLAVTLAPNIANRYAIWIDQKEQSVEVPPAQDFDGDEEVVEAEEEVPLPTPIEIPQELNYNVPFTSQAPFGVWDIRHSDYCEEASLVMAARFFAGQPITSPADADTEMVKLDNWQMENFGFFESTTTEQTAQMGQANYPDLNFEVKNFSLQSMKEELSSGNLVILPAAGRELGNPNFTPPGPIYHMFLVKGYLADGRIITNDPGTRNGADYIYRPEVIENAVADFDPQTRNVDKSRKLMIVVSKNI